MFRLHPLRIELFLKAQSYVFITHLHLIQQHITPSNKVLRTNPAFNNLHPMILHTAFNGLPIVKNVNHPDHFIDNCFFETRYTSTYSKKSSGFCCFNSEPWIRPLSPFIDRDSLGWSHGSWSTFCVMLEKV